MPITRPLLLVLALGIGAGIAAGERALYSLLTQAPWDPLRSFDLVHMMMVATPYVVLALMGVKHVLPWAVGLALTLCVWSWYLYSTVAYYLHPDGSGANIGIGLMLIASPFVISIIAAAIHFAHQDAPSQS